MGALLDQFEASEKSGLGEAKAWVQVAMDPAGTHARLEQLETATAAYDAAEAAASKAQAAAEAAQAAANAIIAEANRKEDWVADQHRRIRLDDQNIAAHHADLDRKRADLAALADRLEARAREQKAFISSLKTFLENAESAAKA